MVRPPASSGSRIVLVASADKDVVGEGCNIRGKTKPNPDRHLTEVGYPTFTFDEILAYPRVEDAG